MADDAAGMRHAPGPAGDEAVSAVPRAAPHDTAADVRSALAGGSFVSATEIAVLDGERFVGTVAIEPLLAAPGPTVLGELARMPPVVEPDVDLETAARVAARRGDASVAVVDGEGRFVGLVPTRRLLRVLELEHDEDMARLGGFISRTSSARAASEEVVLRRLWHRMPWLALGLVGAMASVLIVGAFEDELRAEVLLAFFVPAVVYMADAVGTQTETLVIRGMAIGVSIRAMLARELVTGLVIGALMGAAFFLFALAAWGDTAVAATVGLSLAISCSVATIVAIALPYVLARLGRDPAFGSGPLATVIQDLLSILAYFAVAVWLVT